MNTIDDNYNYVLFTVEESGNVRRPNRMERIIPIRLLWTNLMALV